MKEKEHFNPTQSRLNGKEGLNISANSKSCFQDEIFKYDESTRSIALSLPVLEEQRRRDWFCGSENRRTKLEAMEFVEVSH